MNLGLKYKVEAVFAELLTGLGTLQNGALSIAQFACAQFDGRAWHSFKKNMSM